MSLFCLLSWLLIFTEEKCDVLNTSTVPDTVGRDMKDRSFLPSKDLHSGTTKTNTGSNLLRVNTYVHIEHCLLWEQVEDVLGLEGLKKSCLKM